MDRNLAADIVNGLYHFMMNGDVRRVVFGTEMLNWEMARRAAEETADYIYASCPNGIMQFQNREAMFKYVLPKTGSGMFMEFGVFKGQSINFFAAFMQSLGRQTEIHGFDSFEGIDEDMPGTDLPARGLSCNGEMPQVHPWVKLHKGWFADTLPLFAADRSDTAAFMHIDSDTYASTKNILEHCGKFIRPGTYIIFDEYWNIAFWKLTEHKAWQEFVKEKNIEYRYVAHSGRQVAVEVLSVGSVRQRET